MALARGVFIGPGHETQIPFGFDQQMGTPEKAEATLRPEAIAQIHDELAAVTAPYPGCTPQQRSTDKGLDAHWNADRNALMELASAVRRAHRESRRGE